MFQNLKGLSESQRRSELMAGAYLSPGQQLAQCRFGGMDEVHVAVGMDGRDLTGVTAADQKLRRTPNATSATWSTRNTVCGVTHRHTVGGGLRFKSGPTHVELDEEVTYADPEAILIAAEEDDVEAVVCALGTDPLTAVMAPVALPVPAPTMSARRAA